MKTTVNSNLLHLALIITILTACAPRQTYAPPPAWTYADLRALDSADNVPASQDILALYVRRSGEDLHIRLDLLDITTALDYEIYLILDMTASSKVTVVIPSNGAIRAYINNGQSLTNLKARVDRDPVLDTVVVSLNRAALPDADLGFEVQAFISPSGGNTMTDNIGPIRSDAPPPPRAEILFAFWNTFPAATPAQALRYWDGAHSGPGRARHGLKHLLNAAEATQTPIFLLDLKTATTLSILDYLGAIPLIQKLTDEGLLVLPDAITLSPDLPEWIMARSAKENRQASQDFGLPTSPFLYTPTIPQQSTSLYRLLFMPSSKSTSTTLPFRYQGFTVLPIPTSSSTTEATATLTASSTFYATPAGPSIEMRRSLAQNAANPQRGIFMLGGDFSQTSWGDPSAVYPTFHYLAAHPWIHLLTADDLINFHPSSPTETGYQSPTVNESQLAETIPSTVAQSLRQSPPNPITEAAWQMALSLSTLASPDLTSLRSSYLGQIGHLLAAARWAETPLPATDCAIDLDWDGQPECVLASGSFFSTFEQDGGHLTVAFARTEDGVHQIITPYSQLVVGLGDPSSWDAMRGIAGDPALVPGAFIDSLHEWELYQVTASSGQITFTSPDDSLHKTFSLTPTGLHVEYQVNTTQKVQISVGIDPWRRFALGWGINYREMSSPDSWSWQLEPGPQVVIQSTGNITVRTFTDSRSFLSSPEDPNFDYPPGHFLPFPLALVEVDGKGDFNIEISVR